MDIENLPSNEDALKIVRLYLEKLEALSAEERKILLKTIDFLNQPVFVTNILK